jgi:LysM repeat protein
MGPRIDGTSPAGAYNYGSDSPDAPTATVRLGETSLAQVAQRLGLDPNALQQANPKITDPSKLTVGQELRLPVSAAPPSTDSEPAQPPSLISGPAPDPMAKVMAQMQLGGISQPSAAPSPAVTFKSPVDTKEKQQDRRLTELGSRPDWAHEAWKNLSAGDRLTVLARMNSRYGNAFAQQFLESQQNGSWKKSSQAVYSSDPTSKLPTATPDQLKARGYRLAGEDPRGEVWVRPTGDVIIRNTDTWKFGDHSQDPKGTPPPGGPSSTKKPQTPPKIDDGGTPPPVSPEDRAWNLVGKMQQGIDDLAGLLNQKPVPWDKVHQKVSQIQDAEKSLDKLVYPLDANATPPDLDEDFHDQAQAAKDKFRELYDKAYDANPDFISGPIVTDGDDDDD